MTQNPKAAGPWPRQQLHTPARTVVAPTGGTVRGRFPSTKARRMVAFEQLLELDLLFLSEFADQVVDIHEQPFKLNYAHGNKIRRYTPDFALTLRDGDILIVEVKPSRSLAKTEIWETLLHIREAMERQGHRFIVMSSDTIHDNPPGLPDRQTLDAALMEYEERTLWHYGIEIFNLRYNSRELFPIRHQLGEKAKVQVRYNRADLGYIYVIHPQTGEAIKAPAIEFDYALGLRLEVHQLICKDLREAGESETNPLKRAQAKERMREVIGENLGNKKLQKRKQAARLSGSNSHDLQRMPMPRATKGATPSPLKPVRITVTPKQFKTSFSPSNPRRRS